MTVFIGMSDRTSGIIRGKQIADRMEGSRFVDFNDHASLAKIQNETVIFVRKFDKPLSTQLRNRGCRVGYDLLDMPVADHHKNWLAGRTNDLDWRIYNHPIDFMIVNNTLVKQRVEEFFANPVHIIPHHTVNFNRCKRLRKKVNSIGYIGTADQMLLQNEISEFCESRGIRFVSVHPNTAKECDDVLRNIDIGVIFVDGVEHRDYVLKYKPNTKLSNFQSYGIPTIACGYDSFIEFGGAGDAWVRADEKQQFMDQLEYLWTNQDIRESIAHNAFAAGYDFHIDRVIEKYYTCLDSTGV